MICLPIIVLEFPVRLKFPVLTLAQFGRAYFCARDNFVEWFHMFLDWRRLAVDIDKDPVMPFGTPQRGEAELAAIKAGTASIFSAIEKGYSLERAI